MKRVSYDQVRQENKLKVASDRAKGLPETRSCKPIESFFTEHAGFHKFKFLIRKGALKGLYTVIISNEKPCVISSIIKSGEAAVVPTGFYSDLATQEILSSLGIIQLTSKPSNRREIVNNAQKNYAKTAFTPYQDENFDIDVYHRIYPDNDQWGTYMYDKTLEPEKCLLRAIEYFSTDKKSNSFPREHFPMLTYLRSVTYNTEDCSTPVWNDKAVILNYDVPEISIYKPITGDEYKLNFSASVTRYIPKEDFSADKIAELKSEPFYIPEFLHGNTARILLEFKNKYKSKVSLQLQMSDFNSKETLYVTPNIMPIQTPEWDEIAKSVYYENIEKEYFHDWKINIVSIK